MADLAASDVTITVQDTKIERTMGKRVNRVKIAFGNGTLTYPSGGVPLPAFSAFGLVRNLEYLTIMDEDDATGIVWKHDQENMKLRGYIQGAVISAAGGALSDDYALDGTADPLAAAARQPSGGAIGLSLNNTAAAGTIYTGAMKELQAAGHAPAAAVLYAIAVGW